MKPPARWARACLTGGLLLITVVVVISVLNDSDTGDFGTDQADATTAISEPVDIQATGGIGPAAAHPVIAAIPDPATAQPEPAVDAVPDASPESVPAPVAGIPTGLDLPTLGVHAVVHPVGMSDGQLEVPTNPADVGWWSGSVAAGSPTGATIIDGHVDSAEYGVGALYRLTDLAVGDHIQVTVVGGGTIAYQVNERRTYDKHTGLPPGIFSTDGTHRLALITCGGTFDSTTGSYESNVVVFASPI